MDNLFKFKQFSVSHAQCAMRVNTDGVLLGAWASAPTPGRILDVGTGSGVIALMMAQRYPLAEVDAVEIDGPSAGEARLNAISSPWKDRVCVHHASFDQFAAGSTPASYRLIVSNPPYFVQSLPSTGRKAASAERLNTARHSSADSLPHSQLLAESSKLLHPEGQLSLILPTDTAMKLVSMAPQYGLYANLCTYVCTTAKKAAGRVLLQFGKTPSRLIEDSLILYLDNAQTPSEQYVELIKDFYLWA